MPCEMSSGTHDCSDTAEQNHETSSTAGNWLNEYRTSRNMATGDTKGTAQQLVPRPEVRAAICNREPIKYTREHLRQEVIPSSYIVARGDNLAAMVRKHLGARAVADDVQKYVREVQTINGLDGEPAVGQNLIFPGHRSDGGFVVEDTEGNRFTVWPDGLERGDNKDRSVGYLKKPVAGGGYVETRWGPNDHSNYHLVRDRDGKYLLSEKASHRFIDLTNATPPDQRVERARVSDLFQRKLEECKLSPNQLNRFHTHMRHFEERALRAGMDSGEVAWTYRHISRILEAKDSIDNKLPKEAQRIRLAEQVMAQVADPTRIDQGKNSTCNVATIEARVYARTPAAAARLVADVATTGIFETRGEPHVRIDIRHSLVPDQEAQDYDLDKEANDAARSYASQIFQVTAVNTRYEADKWYRGMVYTLGSCDLTGNAPGTGERLCLYQTEKEDRPRLFADEFADISHHITGLREKDVMLVNSQLMRGRARFDEEKVTSFETEDDLHRKLAALKKDGGLPAILGVHSKHEPFWSDSGGEQAGGSGGWHAVTITDYDSATRRVSVDNQWGRSRDHTGLPDAKPPLPLSRLFKATADPQWVRAPRWVRLPR